MEALSGCHQIRIACLQITVWLQELFDSYVEWAEKWRVAIIAAKSTAVVFSSRRRLYVGDTPPVSYTHLDVYKRQLLYLLSAEFQLDEARYFIVVVVVAGVALTASP